jgi:hypothetical protein
LVFDLNETHMVFHKRDENKTSLKKIKMTLFMFIVAEVKFVLEFIETKTTSPQIDPNK